MTNRIVTVPPSEPFLSTLARALLDGMFAGGRLEGQATERGPLDLSAITLLLPTRRAARGLQAAFLNASKSRAMLLPTIRPIAEGDEDQSLLAGLTGAGDRAALALDLPPAVPELERQLVLSQLVLRWSAANQAAAPDQHRQVGQARSPAQAVALARELSKLIDMVETERVSLDGLADIVREDFSEHWQQTLDFLKIITATWPHYLKASGMMAAAERRNALILAEAERLRVMPPDGPVIVAGVSGSIPATVELMRTVATLPNGAIVLPGLDLGLDEDSWQAITGSRGGSGEADVGEGTAAQNSAARPAKKSMPPHPEHPQFGLKTLLDRLGLTRADIAVLSRAERETPAAIARSERARLVSEALRPSATTGRWLDTITSADLKRAEAAISGVTLIEAPSAQDEAEAVAIILREAAETPGRTAALVSPDRLLARRVAIRLEAWGIRVDDSAGRPLRKTPPGALLDLAITAIAEDFAPRPLMALLKHPLTRLGMDPFVIRRSARALEIAVFRGPYLGTGLDGIRAALLAADRDSALGPEHSANRRTKAARRLFPEDWMAAGKLIDTLEAAYAPLIALFETTGDVPLATLAAAHAATAETLAALPPLPAADGETVGSVETVGTETVATDAVAAHATSALWQGEAGAAARAVLDGLTRDGLPAPALTAAHYPDVYRALVVSETVRPRVPVHSRLSIWGPFEARLQQPDIVILGGLNDGTWPEAADPGPWLNRPMRADLGLPAPEEKIGYAAHDFSMLMGAPTVYLTRAQKIDGVPTVPSRWLMRLQALLGGLGLADRLRVGSPHTTYLAWARQRDRPGAWSPVSQPMPRPPVELRPRKLSVSAVETWIGNPYALYAAHILRLEPLPRLGLAPDASIRGAILHDAMARFALAHPDTLPDDAEQQLKVIIGDVLEAWTGHPRVAAFWLPRFERFATWFAETEAARRAGRRVIAEIKGEVALAPASGLPFTLTARADRLDVGPDGVIITDYKTGTTPKTKDVAGGRKPQLPLEGAILSRGGFGDAVGTTVSGLRYIRASGGEPAGVTTDLRIADMPRLIDETVAGLERHIARFDQLQTPYAATRRGGFSYDYDDFAHLARVAEWSATGTAAAEDTDQDTNGGGSNGSQNGNGNGGPDGDAGESA